MSLALLILANRHEQIIAANIDRWGHVFDEIVVGIDSRSDSAVGAAMIGRVDRLLYVEGIGHFANSSWLLPMASTEWALILDSDEVISDELGAQLAERAMFDTTANSMAVPMRWCWPSSSSYLNDEPWRFDPQIRLVRRSTFQANYPTDVHVAVEMDGPIEYLDAPLFHLDLVLNSYAERSDKVLTRDTESETQMAGFAGTINSVYYLPEERDGQLTTAHASDDDREIIDSALQHAATVARSPRVTTSKNLHIEEIQRIGIAQNQRFLDGDASIGIVSSPTQVIAGKASPVEVRLTNNTRRTLWPRVNGRGVAIGWVARSRAGDEIATGRGELTVPLRSGQSTLVITWILIETYLGECSICLDIVDEGRFWFGVDQHVNLEILAAGSTF